MDRLPVRYVSYEYIWTDGKGGLRSKVRTMQLKSHMNQLQVIPAWNYDGSSTGEALTENSEVMLIPVGNAYSHPFMPKTWCVFCLTRTNDGKKSYDHTMDMIRDTKDNEPWFTFEQEYTLLNPDNGLPLGWHDEKSPPPKQGPYYCGNGCGVAFGRELVNKHYQACMDMGFTLSGLNAEVMPGQWEYQLGPSNGLDVCVELMLSRWVLLRLGEQMNYVVSLSPKPMPGDWNGAGLHTNFSTKAMRESYEPILEYIKVLETRHVDHMKCYGEGNDERLVGTHETSSYENFAWGVGDRGASVRIPYHVCQDKKGYLEDRRPSANANPFDVVGVMLETLCYV
jgi:glutamine synthetase